MTPGSTAGSMIDGVTGGGVRLRAAAAAGQVGEYGGPITEIVTPEDVERIASALSE